MSENFSVGFLLTHTVDKQYFTVYDYVHCYYDFDFLLLFFSVFSKLMAWHFDVRSKHLEIVWAKLTAAASYVQHL